MRTVENHLVAGVSVNGAHDTALDRSIIVKSLCHRSKAVGGAGSSGDDSIISCKSVLVYAVNDGLEVIACGSRNNNLLCACVDVSLTLILRAVETGALENNVYADFTPRKVLCVLLCVNLESLTVNSDGVSLIVSGNSVKIFADNAAVTLLRGIILQKICEHRRLGKVVDSDYLISLCAKHLSERKTSNTSETVNCNFNCHWNLPPEIKKNYISCRELTRQ